MKTREIEVIARGVYVRRECILLCHRKGAPITYLPGGHVEFQEGARQALAREMEEELGVGGTRVTRFLGVVEHAFLQNGKPHAEINLVFAMTVPGLPPRTPPAAAEAKIEFRWCPLNKLAAARLEPAILIDRLPAWLERPEIEPESWASSMLENFQG